MSTERLLAGLRRASVVHTGGLLAVGAIIAAGYFFGVEPVETIRVKQQSLRTALKARSNEESELRRRHRDAEAALRDAQDTLQTRGVELRPASQLNAQIREISALATEMNVDVDSLNASPPAPETQFTRVPVRLSGRASAQDVAAFMRAIRERFADVAVRTFELRADLSPEGGESSVQMEIEWYAAKTDK